jgi:hypothetical protein
MSDNLVAVAVRSRKVVKSRKIKELETTCAD